MLSMIEISWGDTKRLVNKIVDNVCHVSNGTRTYVGVSDQDEKFISDHIDKIMPEDGSKNVFSINDKKMVYTANTYIGASVVVNILNYTDNDHVPTKCNVLMKNLRVFQEQPMEIYVLVDYRLKNILDDDFSVGFGEVYKLVYETLNLFSTDSTVTDVITLLSLSTIVPFKSMKEVLDSKSYAKISSFRNSGAMWKIIEEFANKINHTDDNISSDYKYMSEMLAIAEASYRVTNLITVQDMV